MVSSRKRFGQSSRRPSQDQFAQLMMNQLRKAGHRNEISYDRKEFRLRIQGDQERVLNLSGAYYDYCTADHATLQQVLVKFARTCFLDRRELPECFEDVHPDLLPSVRCRSYLELVRLQGDLDQRTASIWPHRVLGDHLVAALVYDLPEAMRVIQQEQLEQWDVAFDRALAAACENLRQMAEPKFVCPDKRVYVSALRDNYDASRLLLLDVIRQLEVRGDHVAMVPNRDTLIITGSSDPNGLAVMATLAKQGFAEPRAISTLAFRLAGDQWQPWLPPTGHPLHEPFKLLQLQGLGCEYAAQKQVLDALHQEKGQDIFVPSLAAGQCQQTGRTSSCCIWPDGAHTLLARADHILFYQGDVGGRDGRIVAAVTWEQVQQSAGHLLQPLDIYPPRYRTTGFPTPEQLRAMDS